MYGVDDFIRINEIALSIWRTLTIETNWFVLLYPYVLVCFVCVCARSTLTLWKKKLALAFSSWSCMFSWMFLLDNVELAKRSVDCSGPRGRSSSSWLTLVRETLGTATIIPNIFHTSDRLRRLILMIMVFPYLLSVCGDPCVGLFLRRWLLWILRWLWLLLVPPRPLVTFRLLRKLSHHPLEMKVTIPPPSPI